jgi:hypothetical protein
MQQLRIGAVFAISKAKLLEYPDLTSSRRLLYT